MSSNLDPNTNQQTFHHGDPSIFTFHSADRHTSLDAIKYDFSDHIIFNVEFDKRMDLTSAPSVSNCRKAIQSVVDDNLARISGARREETYEPWLNIFNAITETYSSYAGNYTRRFVNTANTIFKSDDGIFYSPPGRKPDFCLVDIDPESEKKLNDIFWRRVAMPVKVKADGPYAEKSTTIKTIVAETADIIRLHLAVRPFQIFSYALMLYGTKYCITLWDHGGLLISSEFDLKTTSGLETFIRIIARVFRFMTYVEMGQDPTVAPVDTKYPCTEDYPEFTVSVPGGDGKTLCRTNGPPIFTSTSIIGRATSVWKVVLHQPGLSKPIRCIMKTAWRRNERRSESDIYNMVQSSNSTLKGVAIFFQGGDVEFGKKIDKAVKVSGLRIDMGLSSLPKQDHVMHRLLLKSYGKGIANFDSPAEFIGAMHDAIRGHQNLWTSNQILHRDISPGNVFIALDPAQDSRGFVSDLDIAKVPPTLMPELPHATRSVKKALLLSRKHGPDITGTAIFMAIKRLRDIKRSDDAAWRGVSRPKHMIHDDLEAFVWVTFYSILIYTIKDLGVVDDPSEQQALKRQIVIKGLGDCFSYSTLEDLLRAKQSFVIGGIEVLEFIEDMNLRKVAVGVWELLFDQNLPLGDPVLMTHDSLCKVFVDAGA